MLLSSCACMPRRKLPEGRTDRWAWDSVHWMLPAFWDSEAHALTLQYSLQDLLIMRGRPYVPEEPEPEPNVLPGSCVAFTCNGELQGVAYRSATARPCSCLMSCMHSAAASP